MLANRPEAEPRWFKRGAGGRLKTSARLAACAKLTNSTSLDVKGCSKYVCICVWPASSKLSQVQLFKIKCTPNHLWLSLLKIRRASISGSKFSTSPLWLHIAFHVCEPLFFTNFNWAILGSFCLLPTGSQVSNSNFYLPKRAKEQGHNLKPNTSFAGGLLQVYRITASRRFKVQMIWATATNSKKWQYSRWLQNSEFMECSTSKSSKKEFQPQFHRCLRQRDPSWIHSIHQSTNTSTVNALQSAWDMAFCWYLNSIWYYIEIFPIAEDYWENMFLSNFPEQNLQGKVHKPKIKSDWLYD